MSKSEFKSKSVGNKTTEIVIGAAYLKLQAASKSLQEGVKQSEELVKIVEENTLKVTNLEDKIGALTTEYEEKRKKITFDLDLDYRSDKEKFVRNYVTENSLVLVKKEEYEDLNKKISDLSQGSQKAVNEALSSQKSQLEKDHKAEISILNSSFSAKEAENKATIESLKNQLAAALQSVEDWKKALDQERLAGIERAKASSIGTLNVGGTNSRG